MSSPFFVRSFRMLVPLLKCPSFWSSASREPHPHAQIKELANGIFGAHLKAGFQSIAVRSEAERHDESNAVRKKLWPAYLVASHDLLQPKGQSSIPSQISGHHVYLKSNLL
ncbi:hypothetical protein HPP92_005103 [Vanilla planifolia]|uniref:Uncharacterized protein n=1 Tax=Vanilla planifolia TaxID=51239 RepID=A0A835RG76_VANPL|nr:hypothetical protein HPP92_005103 [Vanilla planifolia]